MGMACRMSACLSLLHVTSLLHWVTLSCIYCMGYSKIIQCHIRHSSLGIPRYHGKLGEIYSFGQSEVHLCWYRNTGVRQARWWEFHYHWGILAHLHSTRVLIVQARASLQLCIQSLSNLLATRWRNQRKRPRLWLLGRVWETWAYLPNCFSWF